MDFVASRKAARTLVTRIINETQPFLNTAVDETNQEALQVQINEFVDRLEAARDTLKFTTDEWLTHANTEPKDAEKEWATIFEYYDKITATSSRLRTMQSQLNRAPQEPSRRYADNESVRSAVSNSNSNEDSTASPRRRHVRLGKIELRRFGGNLHEWLPFWEMFELAIHNNNDLNDLEKFAYLQKHLTGKAAQSISGLSTSGVCYADAIQILKDEFAQDDRIVESLINKLYSIAKVQNEDDAQALRRLYNKINSAMRSLSAAEVHMPTYVVVVKSILQKCLPEKLRLRFMREDKSVVTNQHSQESEQVREETGNEDGNADAKSTVSSASTRATNKLEEKINRMLAFLKREVEVLEENQELSSSMSKRTDAEAKRKSNDKRKLARKNNEEGYSAAGLLTNVRDACLFCSAASHDVKNCRNNKLSIEKRKELLKTNGRCFRCTSTGHMARGCRTGDVMCEICKRKHATSMCDPDYRNRQQGKTLTAESSNANGSEVTNSLMALSSMRVQVKTAAALAEGANAEQQMLRLVIDGGSQYTFVTEEVSKRLGLKKVGTCSLSVQPFGCTAIPNASFCNQVKLVLYNRFNNERIEILAAEVPTICFDTFQYPDHNDPRFKGLQLADVASRDEIQIPGMSILIGSDQYWGVVTGETIRFNKHLAAVHTKFGWALQGPTGKQDVESTVVGVYFVQATEHFNLENLWKLDQIGIKESEIENDEFVQQFMNNSITQTADQRYEVELPWSYPDRKLHDNYNHAKARLNSLLSRLKRTERAAEYDEIIRGYVREGIAEIVKHPDVKEGRIYYMPHRAVYREDKQTTKVRIVFDASAHLSGEFSLNDLLNSGVGLVPDLVHVLLRFRVATIAMTADIEKAFLQISLCPRDRDCHRFLWQLNGKLTTLRMTRVTFGVTSSPFLLAATIKKHLQQYRSQTARSLEENMYVDDVVLGADNVEDAKRIHGEAVDIMSQAKMMLRKWHSNDAYLRELFGDTTTEQKVLGVIWNMINDEIRVDLSSLEYAVNEEDVATKLTILKTVARIYDPIGLLNPVVIAAKILLQDLWKLELDWEEKIPNECEKRWVSWKQQLNDLKEFGIPRCISTRSVMFQLHVFCDASPRAYGAVAYIKQSQEVRYLMSRSRVSPMKSTELTLPKLELTAALLAARLVDYVRPIIGESVSEVHLWSDSKITLYWMNDKAERWKPHVANRVREIQKITAGCKWHHCPGKENPADLVTRGIKVNELLNSDVWIKGPEWLREDTDHWPSFDHCNTIDDMSSCLIAVDVPRTEEPIFAVNRYSSFMKMIAITERVFQFIRLVNRKMSANLLSKMGDDSKSKAEQYWLRFVQSESYPNEVRALLGGKRIPSNSSLLMLNPFLDEDGVMRISGRLENAMMTYSETHPVILPPESQLTKTIVIETHRNLHHAGVTLMLCKLRERYWVPRGRQVVKSCLSKCVMCQRLRRSSPELPFAQLPKFRVSSNRAFEHVGIDFAGPVYVKDDDKSKTYILLFTCATTRAVHLELVQDMAASTFVRALRRFTARRSIPAIICSDNAKTFKKCSSDLAILYRNLEHDDMKNEIRRQRIKWRYNVELAPWWGGFWERLVRNVKSALRSTLDKRMVSFEELQTILTEIEAVINERPLTYVSDVPTELRPLRPVDFLIGPSSISTNRLDFNEVRNRYDLVHTWSEHQRVLRTFWKRWSTEYLQQLRLAHYQNGKRAAGQPKVDDVVILKDANAKRLSWKLARILQTFNGRDGLVRSCEIRTSSGSLLRRPVQLLLPLELDEEVLCTVVPQDVKERAQQREIATGERERGGEL